MVEAMDPTFSHPGDAMPTSILGTRGKYIHTVGAVGKCKFRPTGNSPYTGIFKGADFGFIRLSAAEKPSFDNFLMKGKPLAPGMGLKFLRSGKDSANLVAMYSVEGQPGNWNFFANSFTNHIGPAVGIKKKILAKKFATATKYIQEVGLSEFASIEENGNESSQPKYPFSLRFEPTSDVKNLFPST